MTSIPYLYGLRAELVGERILETLEWIHTLRKTDPVSEPEKIEITETATENAIAIAIETTRTGATTAMRSATVTRITAIIIDPTRIPSASTLTNPGVKDRASGPMIRGKREKEAGIGLMIETENVSGLASLGVRVKGVERGRSFER